MILINQDDVKKINLLEEMSPNLWPPSPQPYRDKKNNVYIIRIADVS